MVRAPSVGKAFVGDQPKPPFLRVWDGRRRGDFECRSIRQTSGPLPVEVSVDGE